MTCNDGSNVLSHYWRSRNLNILVQRCCKKNLAKLKVPITTLLFHVFISKCKLFQGTCRKNVVVLTLLCIIFRAVKHGKNYLISGRVTILETGLRRQIGKLVLDAPLFSVIFSLKKKTGHELKGGCSLFRLDFKGTTILYSLFLIFFCTS